MMHIFIPFVVLLLVSAQQVPSLVPFSSALGRFGHSTIQLPNGSAVIYGGYDFSHINPGRSVGQVFGIKADMYLMDVTPLGVVWSQIPQHGGIFPPARFYHGAVYDPLQNRMIVSGGSVFVRWESTFTTSFKLCGREDVYAFSFQNFTWKELYPQISVCNFAATNILPLGLLSVILLSHMI